MTKLKITVVKAFTTEELYGEDAPSTTESFSTVCPVHSPGQEYVTDSIVCPEGLCTWAYADMRREINHLLRGGDLGWIGKKGVAYSSCTNGLRNVVFKNRENKVDILPFSLGKHRWWEHLQTTDIRRNAVHPNHSSNGGESEYLLYVRGVS